MNRYVHTFGDYLKKTFGSRVRKLSLHGSFTCPNRDGTLGRGGCTFCNVPSFIDESARKQAIREQLEDRRAELKHTANHYLAYFQAYTSTYGEVKELKALYEEALIEEDVIGLCVGTRPDCVPDEALSLLADYQDQGQEIWLELGLQSAHDKTLKKINRRHDFAAYVDAVERAHSKNLKVCTHLIIGLPGEDPEESLETIAQVLAVGVEGIKLHPLHIVKGSLLEKSWNNKRVSAINLETYCQTAAEMIRRTPEEVVYHRVSASARPPTLLAPQWCENRWLAMQRITEILEKRGGQGSALQTDKKLLSESQR